MNILIAGSRTLTDYALFSQQLKKYTCPKDVIVCGYDPKTKSPKGADEMAWKYAKENNIEVRTFPADWDKYGKSAGAIRNKQMVNVADYLVAFWDGTSKGTAITIGFWRSKVLAITGNMHYNLQVVKF